MNPALIDFSISAFSSVAEPMHFSSFLSSVIQIGRGVPQYLERERFQSTRFSSHLPNLPVPVDGGFQLMVLLSSIIRSRKAVVRMNHESSG